MLKRLQVRFIVIMMVLLGITISLGLSVFCYSVYSNQQASVQRALEASAKQMMSVYNGTDFPEDGAENRTVKTYAVIVTQDGTIISARGSVNELASGNWNGVIHKVLNSDSDTGYLKKQRLAFRNVEMYNSGYHIIAFASTSEMHAYLVSLITSAVILFASGMVVLFIISCLLAKIAIRPVKKAWDQQQQFIADASHELKTPIAVILANDGIVLSHPESTVKEQEKWIRNSREEATHMKKLVENLLYLARSDARQSKMIFCDIPVGEVVMDVCLQFEPVAFEKSILLNYEQVDTSLHMQGDQTKLKQLTHILVDNACKYAAPDSEVTVVLRNVNGQTLFSVHNDGKPIPADDLPHLFERFYRANKARNREEDAEGYGLGLAIAKSITEEHRAKISVTSTAENGTTFAVAFRKG